MASRTQSLTRAGSRSFQRLTRLRRQRRVQNAATLGLVVLGPLLAVATFAVLGPAAEIKMVPALRVVLLADLVYILVVAALIFRRIARMVADRRAQSAGSRLHLRLTGVFALIALIPTITVAVFAAITINFGLEGWFSDRVRNVVGASLSAAQAYEEDERRDLRQDARALARYLEIARASARDQGLAFSDGELRRLLSQGQDQIQRGLREAFVIDGEARIRARGARSYLFDFEAPSTREMARAVAGETVLIKDLEADEFRALRRLDGFFDRYLYVSREVDGAILATLDETQETARFYNELESQRGRMLFEFGLLYLAFALILIMAAIWLGLWFAERLSRPVGQLAGAAERVGAGDFDVQVAESEGDDEIATLGRVFNQMTQQLKGQRDTLLATNAQIEERRRLFDSVLSSVTAGVIGLDADGAVSFVNRAAGRLVGIAQDAAGPLPASVPEFSSLFNRLQDNPHVPAVQEQIKLTRDGVQETLLVRMAARVGDDEALEGYVVAFDDVSDLVAAQRMAAWGDVARRIAHEIKNPLTPIQLSAQRIKRKFRPDDAEDAEKLDQLTDVIVRQTNDLRRIVDEFSQFARMPEPKRAEEELGQLLRHAVALQDGQEVPITAELPQEPVPVMADATMIGQALTNLIKNGLEAIESLQETGAPEGHSPHLDVSLSTDGPRAMIDITDNGIGFPQDRARLFEPYVTTRVKGTGLGLPIVRKIIEEHGGQLALLDAPRDPSGQVGARVRVTLPLYPAPKTERTEP